VTSNLARAICNKYGLELVQTLTGFKYIGAKATELEHTAKEFFFGYEESYGYVLKDFVHDKDSLQSSLIVCEMASFYKSLGKTLVDVLYDLFKEFGYYREGVYNITLEGQAGLVKIEAIMNHFMTNPIKEIAGKKVAIFEDYRRLLRFSDEHQAPIDLPRTSAVKFIFDDGGWFALRPSGTEPKIKIYFAIVAKTEESAMELISKLQTEMKTIIEGIQVK
jgi:phosphoglucomutase